MSGSATSMFLAIRPLVVAEALVLVACAAGFAATGRVAFAVVAMLAAVVFSALIGWTLLTRRKPAEDGDAA